MTRRDPDAEVWPDIRVTRCKPAVEVFGGELRLPICSLP